MGKKSEEKKSFKLYNDYKKHFDLMSDEEAGKVIKAVFAFVNHEDVPSLEGAAQMAYSFIEAQLDRDRIAYDKKCEINKLNGAKGGRPKKTVDSIPEDKKEDAENKNPEKPNGFTKIPEKPKNEEEPAGKKVTRKRFVPPTVEEVRSYCLERGNSIDAEYFCDYYRRAEWELKKGVKMKDWKAAVRTWEKNEIKWGKGEEPQTKGNAFHNFNQRKYDYDDLETRLSTRNRQ